MRAGFLEQQGTGVELLAATLAHRGKLPDDLQLRVTAAALGAAIMVAFDRWQKDEGKSDLIALLDQTIDAWGSQTQAASYSWMSPPRRSRRRS